MQRQWNTTTGWNYLLPTKYPETKFDFYFKKQRTISNKVEKVTNDEFNGNRKL